MLIVSMVILIVLLFIGFIFVLINVMSKSVNSATKQIEEMNEDFALKEQEITKRLNEAKEMGKETVRMAQEEAEKLRADVVKAADGEREKVIMDARTKASEIIQQADMSRNALLSELEVRITQGSRDKACDLIQEVLPEEFRKAVHQLWSEDLLKDIIGQLERLKIPDEVQEVKIVTAFAFGDEQRVVFSNKLKGVLNREIKLFEEIDEKLVAGFIIILGSLVLDGSLKNKVQKQAKNAK